MNRDEWINYCIGILKEFFTPSLNKQNIFTNRYNRADFRNFLENLLKSGKYDIMTGFNIWNPEKLTLNDRNVISELLKEIAEYKE